MFKTCSKCGRRFSNRAEFLNGAETELIGYMPDFEDPENGIFLFNHSCKTTISVRVGDFLDLFSGPRYTEPKTGGEGCPSYCFDIRNTEPCPHTCRYAFVRSIMHVLNAELTHPADPAQPDAHCA